MSAKAGGEQPHPFLRSVSAVAIVDAALRLLGDRPVSELKVEEVLFAAHTSTSSLYHHFGNRQGLCTAVEKERFRRLALAEDRARLADGYEASTEAEFLAFVEANLRRAVTDPANAEVRQQRFRVLAAALDDSDLTERVRIIQGTMYHVIAEVIEDAKRRGLINPDVDAAAFAAMMHGLAMGRTGTEAIFPDVDRWLSVAVPALLAPLRLPPASDAPA